MKLAVRVNGLGSRLGHAAKRISDAARSQSVRRAGVDTVRIFSVQSNEASHVVSQSRSSGDDLRDTER